MIPDSFSFRSAVCLLVLVAAGMSIRSMAPTITAGDSAELAAAQATLGVAHAPGYPLYILAGKAFVSAMPFGHPAYRTNLFSLFCGGAVAAALFMFFHRATGRTVLPAISILCFLMVPAVRAQFLSTEVFGLNCLWAVALLFVLWLALDRQIVKFYYLAAFLFGLGLGNQHTIILLLPAFLLPAGLLTITGKMHARHWAGIVFFALLGASICVYIPLRSLRQPLLDWEDPETFARFWGLLTRARYGTLQLAQGVGSSFDPRSLYEGTVFFAKLLGSHLGPLLPIALIGGTYLALRDRSSRLFAASIALALLFSGPVFFSLTQGWKQENPEIVARFLPLPATVLFILGAYGFLRLRRAAWTGTLLAAGLLLLWSRSESLARQWRVYDLGRAILQTMPPGSLLFTDRADEAEFSLAYLRYAENRRPDINLVDCNASVTRSIYGEDYYGIWGRPRLARRELVEKEMIRASRVPVFYATVEPAMIPSIPKQSRGILFSAARPGAPEYLSRQSWEEYYVLRGHSNEPGFRGDGLLASHCERMGNYYLDIGEDVRARRYLAAWSRSIPGHSFFHHAALAAHARRRNAIAADFFARAYESESEKDKILCNWGFSLEQAGRFSEAEAKYLSAAADYPAASEPHYRLGALYWKKGEWRKVEASFAKVVELDPGHPDARKFLEAARSRK